MPVGDSMMQGELVREELARVLAGPALSRSPQLRAMLDYLVTETLAGRGSQIKAFNIAVDVFGRNASFDPTIDSIVRVQATRLREALANHYKAEGAESRLRIELPKGTYVPAFSHNDAPPTSVPASRSDASAGCRGASAECPAASGTSGGRVARSATDRNPLEWIRGHFALRGLHRWATMAILIGGITVAALVIHQAPLFQSRVRVPHDVDRHLRTQIDSLSLSPFKSMIGTQEAERFAKSLTAEIATSLTRTGLLDLRLTLARLGMPGEDLRKDAIAQGSHWVLTGVLHSVGASRRANVYLMDVDADAVIWSEAYSVDDGDAGLGALVDAVMLDLRLQLYIAAKRKLAAKSDLTPPDLFVLATWSPGLETNSLAWQLEQIALARKAIAANGRFGPAHSVLADKLSLLASLIPTFDNSQTWREAATAASEARVLAPHSSEVAFNLALYHFHAGEGANAMEMVGRTLELAPRHTLARIWKLALPYNCSRSPNEVIEELRSLDSRLAPANPARWQTNAWIARLNLNNGAHAAAIEAARGSMNVVPNLGAALTLAVALVHVGGAEEAQRVMDEQKLLWKDFTFAHHISVALPRICKSSPMLDELLRIYQDAAAVLR